MRKWLTMLFALVFLFITAVNTAAETAQAQRVFIAEKEISFYVPDDHIIVQRDNNFFDSRLAERGLTRAFMDAYMKQSNAYLWVFSPDFSYEMSLIILDFEDLENLNAYDDERMQLELKAFVQAFEGTGGKKVVEQSVKRAYGMTFFRVVADMDSAQALQYATIVDNQTIIFSLVDYTCNITDEETALMEQMLEMSDFTKHKE